MTNKSVHNRGKPRASASPPPPLPHSDGGEPRGRRAGPTRAAKPQGGRMARAAFLFPGQGAQYVGMGRQLRETLPAARRLFNEAADVLGYDLAEVCASGPAEKLNSTAVSQPAIFVSSLAALESLGAANPAAEAECVAAAGLSL